MPEIRASYEFMEIMEIMDEKFRGDFEFMDGCKRHFSCAAAGANLDSSEGN